MSPRPFVRVLGACMLAPLVGPVACGQGDARRELAADRGAPSTMLSSVPVTADTARVAPPSDLALRLGGQTGSEYTDVQQANVEPSPNCPSAATQYSRSAITPLGFSGDAIFERLLAAEYRWVSPGTAGESVELVLAVGSAVTYFDREPTVNGRCPDALLVPLRLDLTINGEPALSELGVEVFAASPSSFAAFAYPGPERVTGPLGSSASSAPLLVVLEASSEQIVLWLYRNGVEGELIGQLIAP